MQISRFGVIPKGVTGKCRLILDLSSPEGASVNCGIDKKLCALKYATVDQAAESVVRRGRGTLMAKINIKAAYLSTRRTDGCWECSSRERILWTQYYRSE